MSQTIAPVRPKIWVRAEQKNGEHRCILTPSTARALIDAGYEVHVERNPTDSNYRRIFNDVEFVKEGCFLEDTYSYPGVGPEFMIFGLKELPDSDEPLSQTHLSFMHVFKYQIGWQGVMKRFAMGQGTLYDLEFLKESSGRRVAAFGFHAGFGGAALAAKTWAWQLTHPGEALPPVRSFTGGNGYYENENALVSAIGKDMDEAYKIAGKMPKVMVIGALGRCGSGSIDCLQKLGVKQIEAWDVRETSEKPGPYKEIADCNIFINCVYLAAKIPPLVTKGFLSEPDRELTVICDVSCDPTSENNPVPVYDRVTTFDSPTVAVHLPGKQLDVIAIDHLPALLPRESSEVYSHDLLPTMLNVKDRATDAVWMGAKDLFDKRLAEAGSAAAQV